MDSQMIQTISLLLAGTVRIFIPITFAALASTYAAQSGIINMALDGMMLMGAFFGVLGSYLTGSPLFGLFLAIISGIIMSLFFSILTVNFRCSQALVGLGMNMLSRGLTVVFLQAVWNTKGKSTTVEGLGVIRLPFLKGIPIIGEMFGEVSPLLILLVICLIVSYFVIFKTVLGLRVRVVGEKPIVAASQGISVVKMQYICVVISGILAAIGGAYLSIGDVNIFSRDMVAGRGFIGMAIAIFGGSHPVGVTLGGLLFGFAQSLQYRLQAFKIQTSLILMIPYVLTLIVLALNRKKNVQIGDSQL